MVLWLCDWTYYGFSVRHPPFVIAGIASAVLTDTASISQYCFATAFIVLCFSMWMVQNLTVDSSYGFAQSIHVASAPVWKIIGWSSALTLPAFIAIIALTYRYLDKLWVSLTE